MPESNADTISMWLDKSLMGGAAAKGKGGMPTNVDGMRYFLSSLEALSDREFFKGMAYTKLWYLYDLPKLLRYSLLPLTLNSVRKGRLEY